MPFITLSGRNLLYLHVPKTGGTTIEAWMKTLAPLQFHSGMPPALRCTPQHLRMVDFRTLFAPGFFDVAVMTVRNPYDRIASEFRMRAVLAGKSFWNSYPDFSIWLERTLEAAAKNPFHLDNHLRPQWQFHGTGVEVLKFETGLPAILARMGEIFGAEPPAEPGHHYDTASSGIAFEWDLADRLRVQEFYRKDFEVFDYPM